MKYSDTNGLNYISDLLHLLERLRIMKRWPDYMTAVNFTWKYGHSENAVTPHPSEHPPS